MAILDAHLPQLPGSYLFTEVERRAAECQREQPGRPILRLGIGDVRGPLVPAVTEAMVQAVAEMGREETFRGYGPEGGYPFLRQAIAEDYALRGVALEPEEIFISDGAKSDCGGLGDLFSQNCRAAVCDPVYPVYLEASALAGRAGAYDPATGRWSGITYLPCVVENHFTPELPAEPVDLIYLCSPNNPTGQAMDRVALERWVGYANGRGAVILFDGAYEAFLTDPTLPRSIYEIPGARTCAIEVRSYSKTAGFTGVRCGYTVIPKELEREGHSLNALWRRRQGSRCNGVSYITQRGAWATHTPQGKAQLAEQVAGYLANAGAIRTGLAQAGLTVAGGEHSPYVWARVPKGMGSWDFFDQLLHRAGVVTTPGAGFGPGGEGYIRLTGFNGPEETREAVARICAIL